VKLRIIESFCDQNPEEDWMWRHDREPAPVKSFRRRQKLSCACTLEFFSPPSGGKSTFKALIFLRSWLGPNIKTAVFSGKSRPEQARTYWNSQQYAIAYVAPNKVSGNSFATSNIEYHICRALWYRYLPCGSRSLMLMHEDIDSFKCKRNLSI
jgi:hypothetical protein